MLTGTTSRSKPRSRQRGVVLMMALIVLVAMTLAAIALVRSVDTTNVIAGNLAFQQAATNSGDVGSETAVAWLTANAAFTASDAFAQGYSSSWLPLLGASQSWDNYWNTVLVPAGMVVTLPPDAAGNTVAYVIQRLCNTPNVPNGVGLGTQDCAQPNAVSLSTASSRTAGTVALTATIQTFYRVTSRIAGPRNTVSYVQTLVAMN